MAKVSIIVEGAKDRVLASGGANFGEVVSFQEIMPYINEELKEEEQFSSLEDLEKMARKKIMSLGFYGNSYIYATGLKWDP